MIRLGYTQWHVATIRERHAANLIYENVGYVARPVYGRYNLTFNHRSYVGDFLRGLVSLRSLESDLEKHTVQVGLNEVRLTDMFSQDEWWSEKTSTMRRLCALRSRFAEELVGTVRDLNLVPWNYAAQQAYYALVKNECIKATQGLLPGLKDLPNTDTETLVDIRNAETIPQTPEFVAIDLVKDIVTPDEFEEFFSKNYITIWTNEYVYRVYRRSHAMLEVWDRNTKKFCCSICIVFMDANMPPSDEVVMKYVLCKHDQKTLWEVGAKHNFHKPSESPFVS